MTSFGEAGRKGKLLSGLVNFLVTPAKAGVQTVARPRDKKILMAGRRRPDWMPAFAGMTDSAYIKL